MKSLVIAGRRLPVDPLLETLGLLLADDYFGVGIMVQAQDEFAAEIVAQIADALHADDVLAVGAEEAGRIELSFEFVHAHGNRLRGAIVEMQAHDFVFGEYVVYLPYRNGLVAVAVRQQEPLAVAATALLQGLEELAQGFVRCVAAAASDLLDRCGEFVCVYGFKQVVKAVILERLHGILVVGGREDNRHGGASKLNPSERRMSARIRSDAGALRRNSAAASMVTSGPSIRASGTISFSSRTSRLALRCSSSRIRICFILIFKDG